MTTQRQSEKYRIGLNAEMFKLAGFETIAQHFPIDEETLLDLVCTHWRSFSRGNPDVTDDLINSYFTGFIEQAVDDSEDETEEAAYRRLYAVMDEYGPNLNSMVWAIYEQIKCYIQPFLDREGMDTDCAVVFETLRRNSIVVSFHTYV